MKFIPYKILVQTTLLVC